MTFSSNEGNISTDVWKKLRTHHLITGFGETYESIRKPRTHVTGSVDCLSSTAEELESAPSLHEQDMMVRLYMMYGQCFRCAE